MRYPLPPQRLFLDALVAAALLTILILTPSHFIQAPALNWLGLGTLLVTPARDGFCSLRSHLLAYPHPRINTDTVPGYHRHPLGLPLFLASRLPRVLVSLCLRDFRCIYTLAAAVLLAIAWIRLHEHSIKIVAEIGGRISSIPVKEGDRVHTGDVLIQLDTSDLLLKKHTLESRIHQAELQVFSPELPGLYRELAQTNLDLTRLTITSPANGLVTFIASLHTKVVQPGDTIAVLVPP